MTARLTLAEAQEQARAYAYDAERAGVIPDALDWANPGNAAVQLLVTRRGGWSTTIVAVDRIADALLAYQRHLDYAAGQAAERANAVALCEQAATRHTRAAEAGFARRRLSGEAIDRVTAKASELRTMAAYIERGDRAEAT